MIPVAFAHRAGYYENSHRTIGNKAGGNVRLMNVNFFPVFEPVKGLMPQFAESASAAYSPTESANHG